MQSASANPGFGGASIAFVLGGRQAHKVSVKEAALWSRAWFSLVLVFNAGLWWYLNGTVGVEIADRKAYSWVLYIFGAFLVVTGMRMLAMAEKTPDWNGTRC